KLDMGDERLVAFVSGDEFAARALLVVKVILDEQVVAAHFIDYRNRLLHRVEIEAGNVVVIDRLDQQANAMLAQFLRGQAQIADESGAQHIRVHALRRDAGKAIDLRTVERRGVIDGIGHAASEIVYTIRQNRNAALAASPV